MTYDLYPPPDPHQPADPNQPHDPYQYQDPYPYHQPSQPQVPTVYVPVGRGAKPPGAGVAALTLGIVALVFFAVGIALGGGIGGAFAFLGLALAVIGTPLAIVNLVRRARAKLSLGVSIAAIAATAPLVTALLIAIIVTTV